MQEGLCVSLKLPEKDTSIGVPKGQRPFETYEDCGVVHPLLQGGAFRLFS